MSKSNKKKIEPINKNKALLQAKIKSMIKNGRDEVAEIDELKNYPLGSLISYLRKDGVFKSGGFLWKVSKDYFIYLDLNADQKFRVRMKNIDKMWVGSVYDVTNDTVSLIKSDKKETSKPVTIGDIVIYYAKDSYDYNRYICTNKYKLMEKWHDTFGNE